MDLPSDNFSGIPLTGHISSLRRGESRYYWKVERLIFESASLPTGQSKVDDLFGLIQSGTWFDKNQPVTIGLVYQHFYRAQSSNLQYPVILSSDGKVMDGSHRIVRAKLEGIEVLETKKFKIDPEPDFIE